jgi:hypothetical protein
MSKVRCIDATGFSLITVGKEYEVTSESRDYYHIINNYGAEKRYGKQRFEPVATKKTAKADVVESEEKPVAVQAKREPKPKPVGVICKFPKGSIVKFNETYVPIGETSDGSKYIFEINGAKHEILKSRFVTA